MRERDRNRPSAAITVATLRPDQVEDLVGLSANPRHPLQPQRRDLLRRLGLIVPIEPPRAPHDGTLRRIKRRAYALTELGDQMVARMRAA